jgi:hypothetical protein
MSLCLAEVCAVVARRFQRLLMKYGPEFMALSLCNRYFYFRNRRSITRGPPLFVPPSTKRCRASFCAMKAPAGNLQAVPVLAYRLALSSHESNPSILLLCVPFGFKVTIAYTKCPIASCLSALMIPAMKNCVAGIRRSASAAALCPLVNISRGSIG